MKIFQTFGISSRGSRSLLKWTMGGILGCTLISVLFNYFMFRDLDAVAQTRGLVVAIILPVLLAGPLFFYLTLKMRQMARMNHQLNELATKDFGTGLLNRRALIIRIDNECKKMAFQPTLAHLFLVVDADRFKLINDKFGHTSGDEALKLIAGALEKSVRSYDIVGRVGGEEFAIFLPNVSAIDAPYIADRLRRAVAALEFKPNGVRYDLSVSIGGIIYRHATAFTALFKAADINLYSAKEQGRNCSVITVYDAGLPIDKSVSIAANEADMFMDERRKGRAGINANFELSTNLFSPV